MARISLPNPRHVLKIGMVAEARITGDRKISMMTVPGEAIVRDAQGATMVFVYFPEQRRVYSKRVKAGALYGTEVEIKEGLSGDESIVIAGQDYLRDGMPVTIASRPPKTLLTSKGNSAMNPIKSSLRHPSVTLVLTAMAVALGIHALMKMPRTEDPTVTIRTGLVIAQYPGATSEQVEKQVTKTLEKHIFKFPEVRKELTYSTSRPGLVIINVELEDYVKNSDLFWAKLRNEMIETAQTELPSGVRGPIVNSDFGDTVALLLAVHGERYGYRELRDYVDTIQDRFRTVRDVGKMMRYGDQSEQIWITGSLARLSQYFADPTPHHAGAGAEEHYYEHGKGRDRPFKDPHENNGAVYHGRPDQEM